MLTEELRKYVKMIESKPLRVTYIPKTLLSILKRPSNPLINYRSSSAYDASSIGTRYPRSNEFMGLAAADMFCERDVQNLHENIYRSV